jgi:Cu/Ag efflux protein CusF
MLPAGTGEKSPRYVVKEGRMFYKLSRLLAVAFAVLFMVSTVALAAEESLSGTVQSVNAREGTITLKSDDGKTVELKAPAALLTDLQAGDAVEVKASGKQATMINKMGAMPRRPGMDSPQRPGQSPQPGGMPRSQEPGGAPPRP